MKYEVNLKWQRDAKAAYSCIDLVGIPNRGFFLLNGAIKFLKILTVQLALRERIRNVRWRNENRNKT